MPELPEVETTRRGIEPHVLGRVVERVTIRDGRLRWPIDKALPSLIQGANINATSRRGKYLLLEFTHGALLIHLGMSGSLRVVEPGLPPGRHDHVDIALRGGQSLRFNDPRRFGSFHFTSDPPSHPLLSRLGPEPLSDAFNAEYLARAARGRKAAVKTFLMDAHVVVGVGNIYANEALYLAGIHPARPAGRISRARFATLVDCVRQVLAAAIESGGTTLRDFVGGDGRPGYFRQSLRVYEREGEPCPGCGTAIRRRVLGQRATYYCSRCQR